MRQKELGVAGLPSLGLVPPKGEGRGGGASTSLDGTSCQGGGASGKVAGLPPPQAPKTKQKKKIGATLMKLSIMVMEMVGINGDPTYSIMG